MKNILFLLILFSANLAGATQQVNVDHIIELSNVNISFVGVMSFDQMQAGSNWIVFNTTNLTLTSTQPIAIVINEFNTINDSYNITITGSGTLTLLQQVNSAGIAYNFFKNGTYAFTEVSNPTNFVSHTFTLSGSSETYTYPEPYSPLLTVPTKFIPSSISPGGGNGGSTTATPTGTETGTGRKDYSFNLIFSGQDGRAELPNSGEHGIYALNLFFNTQITGTYTISLSTYTNYDPAPKGAIKYFTLSPAFDLKPTSSIELTANQPISLYQLHGDAWKKLPAGTRAAQGTYRFPITSFGVFAEVPAMNDEIATAPQPSFSITSLNLDVVWANLQNKDREIYEMLKIKLAWLVEIADKLKSLILTRTNIPA